MISTSFSSDFISFVYPIMSSFSLPLYFIFVLSFRSLRSIYFCNCPLFFICDLSDVFVLIYSNLLTFLHASFSFSSHCNTLLFLRCRFSPVISAMFLFVSMNVSLGTKEPSTVSSCNRCLPSLIIITDSSTISYTVKKKGKNESKIERKKVR